MRFKYLLDPLFLLCVAMYFLNRLVLKPHIASPFLHEHLNDLMCIPFWVPIMLFLQRKIGLRKADAIPSSSEVVIPLIIWSFAFEIWLPTTQTFAKWCTADPMDILFYAIGALGALWFWNVWYGHRFGTAQAARR